jgi:hypothetical protein
MTDDVGFAAPSTFGGVIPTPALDRIANAGLRYTNFHSTSLRCRIGTWVEDYNTAHSSLGYKTAALYAEHLRLITLPTQKLRVLAGCSHRTGRRINRCGSAG